MTKRRRDTEDLQDQVANAPRHRRFTGLIVLLIVVVTGMSVAAFGYFAWDWLAKAPFKGESNGAMLRNLGLLFAALASGFLVAWRNMVAERQADAALTQARVAQQQAQAVLAQTETARSSVRNERFHRGVEMLGSERLVVRLGGTYALRDLANEEPDSFLGQSVDTLCDFARQAGRL